MSGESHPSPLDTQSDPLDNGVGDPLDPDAKELGSGGRDSAEIGLKTQYEAEPPSGPSEVS